MSRILLFILAFFLLVFTSCQSEFDDFPLTEDGESITAGSVTADYVARTSTMDGSFDNIVDRASCIALQFPYVVIVNEIEITIESVQDLRLIEEVLDESDLDEDLMELVFPVTVITAGHEEVVVNSSAELRELAEACVENGEDEDMECLDFVYPVTLFTFDTDSQQTSSVTVDSDREMYRFFKSLEPGTRVGFRFPLTLETYEGVTLQVNSHEELRRLFEEYELRCDEDDDNDYNDDDFTEELLDEYLMECPWNVQEVIRDAVDQTEQYQAFLMVFEENGQVQLKNSLGAVVNGTWETRLGDHGVVLQLQFETLVDFNLEWLVYEIREGEIKLYSGEGNKILMKQNCDPDSDGKDELRQILRECSWVIRKVKQQGEPLYRLLGYEFNFLADGVLTLGNGTTIKDGNWEVSYNAAGQLALAMEIDGESALDFEWPIAEMLNDRLVFKVEDIGYEMYLERVCNNNQEDGDVVEIRSLMKGGYWQVAAFESDMTIETQAFAAYTFGFGEEAVLSMTLGDTGVTQAGLWRVIRNSEGKLRFYVNGGESEPLYALTDRYEIASMNEQRIELHAVSETSGEVKILVFERI